MKEVETAFKKCKSCKVFNFVKDKEGKIMITMGNFVASAKKFDNFDQAEKYVGSKPWELIINVAEIIVHYEKQENENATKANQEGK